MSSGSGGRQIHFGTWRDRCVQTGAEAGVCSPAAAATGAINWTGHLGDTLACCWRLMGTGVMARRPGLQAWGGPQVCGLRLQARPGPLARAEPYSCLAWQGGRAPVPQPPPGRGHQEATTAGRRGSPPSLSLREEGNRDNKNRAFEEPVWGALAREGSAGCGWRAKLPPPKHVHRSQLRSTQTLRSSHGITGRPLPTPCRQAHGLAR